MSQIAKLYRNAFLCLLVIGLSSCVDRSRKFDTAYEEKWTDARIDSTISTDSVFRRLNKQKELFSLIDLLKDDSLSLRSSVRSSDVAHHSGIKLDLRDTSYTTYTRSNNCKAYFWRSDTLLIDIGMNDGFGGCGFMINYKNKKFYTQPYSHSDVISDGEDLPTYTYEIIYQTLTLDKPTYAVGDSLFGHIEFASIEIMEDRTIKHFGKGHFRAKVFKEEY